MKKYVKPMIVLERYELSQTIADCAWELTNASADSCSASPDNNIIFGGVSGNLFTESTGGCVNIPGVNYEDYCFQTGSGSGFSVFKS